MSTPPSRCPKVPLLGGKFGALGFFQPVWQLLGMLLSRRRSTPAAVERRRVYCSSFRGRALGKGESCCCCVLVSSGGVGVTAREFRARRLSQQLREALCGIVVVEWSGVEGNTVQTWLDIFLEVALGAGLGGEAGMRRSLGM